MHPCVCACGFMIVFVCIPVREPHALSAEVEVRGWRHPQVILNILRPCTTGGELKGREGMGGGVGQGMQGSEVKGRL